MTEDDLYPLLAPLAEGRFIPTLHRSAVTGSLSLAALGNFLDYYRRGRRRSLRQAESSVSVQVDVYSSSITEARTIRNMALDALQVLRPANVVKRQLMSLICAITGPRSNFRSPSDQT